MYIDRRINIETTSYIYWERTNKHKSQVIRLAINKNNLEFPCKKQQQQLRYL